MVPGTKAVLTSLLVAFLLQQGRDVAGKVTHAGEKEVPPLTQPPSESPLPYSAAGNTEPSREHTAQKEAREEEPCPWR